MQNFKTEFNKHMETLRRICEEIKMKLKILVSRLENSRESLINK